MKKSLIALAALCAASSFPAVAARPPAIFGVVDATISSAHQVERLRVDAEHCDIQIHVGEIQRQLAIGQARQAAADRWRPRWPRDT